MTAPTPEQRSEWREMATEQTPPIIKLDWCPVCGRHDRYASLGRSFHWAKGERCPGTLVTLTEDCLFENTVPPPDGERYKGSAAVGEFWERFFGATPSARFETEELFAADDRAVVRWVFHWEDENGPGHVRGVDVMRVRDGKVAEKLSYVKG